MGRRRKQEDAWMPEKVYRGKVQYEYRPTKQYAIKLGKLDTPQQTIIDRAADARRKFLSGEETVEFMADQYFESIAFKDLKPRTQKDYRTYWRNLEGFFNKMNRNRVTSQILWKYHEQKADRSGKTQANLHLAFIKTLFKWGHVRGLVNNDPAAPVKKFKTQARDVYITDKEYVAVYRHAPRAIRFAMEISYLCAAREADVVGLKKEHVSDLGIYIKQGKTGYKQFKMWTPRLLHAIFELSLIDGFFESEYVIISPRNKTRYTLDGFRTEFSKARQRARNATGMELNFSFHDIKAKGISDFDGDKQKFSGHKTRQMMLVYDRKTHAVETLNLPTIQNELELSD